MKIEKILLVYNPYAGQGQLNDNLDLIINRFQKHNLLIIPVRTDNLEYTEQMIIEAGREKYKKLIVAGGDGSINIVVNFMIKNGVDLPLAIFPTGTANDFAYCFDLPNTIQDMIPIALQDHYTQADIGKCNGRYFVNVAAMGSIVDVSQKTNPALKNTLGKLSYYLTGLSELPNIKPITFTFRSEDFNASEEIYFMIVLNGISAGGFRKLGIKSSIDDGKFDVIIFKELPMTELLPLAHSVIHGKHDKNRNVIYFQTSEISIDAAVPVGTDVDGETGETFPLHFKILPQKLRINTPPSDDE